MNDSTIYDEAFKERDRFLNERKSNREAPFLAVVKLEHLLLSELKEDEENVNWLWEGYLAKGSLTLLSALWKSGKTTLISQLLRCMQFSEDFAGKTTRPCKVVIISEESKNIWARRSADLHIELITWIVPRPLKQKPNLTQWVQLLKNEAVFCKENQVDLVIIDTLSGLWGVKNENDAADVQEALTPLNYLLDQDIAVLLIHHTSKGETRASTSARGSGVLGSSPDILVEFKRNSENNPQSTERVLQSYSRFEETPQEVVIDLVDGEYITLGTKSEVSKASKLNYVLSIIPNSPDGLTANEVLNEWDDDEVGLKKPKVRTIHNYLNSLIASCQIEVVGEAKTGKTSATKYGKPTENSLASIFNDSKERSLPMEDSVDVKECYACKGTDFWTRKDGGLVCARCHPQV